MCKIHLENIDDTGYWILYNGPTGLPSPTNTYVLNIDDVNTTIDNINIPIGQDVIFNYCKTPLEGDYYFKYISNCSEILKHVIKPLDVSLIMILNITFCETEDYINICDLIRDNYTVPNREEYDIIITSIIKDSVNYDIISDCYFDINNLVNGTYVVNGQIKYQETDEITNFTINLIRFLPYTGENTEVSYCNKKEFTGIFTNINIIKCPV